MTIEQYIENINQRYQLGNATEHTFRGDLQQLLESLVPTIRATNEPKRQSCGAPDYILTKKDIPVGFIEAKDIGDKDLDGTKKTGNKEQFDRYKASLNNLIFTDYINFHLYREGEFVTKISIAEITDKGIKPLPENFGNFENLIKDFCVHVGQTIKSSKKLAEMMAGKARLLADIIEKSLTSDEENQENSTLKEQMLAFKQILIHDITPQGFADVYAQTIAYGMFAARLHDPTLDNFSRQEAAELIPKSNPFLRKLFGYIAGPDIDDRIKWVVENLSEIFLACNVEEILKNYGKAAKMEDPIIHFYETFLSEYDPKLRKSRGVWYTPQPVVNFIVRAVDDILKTEFDLPQGLADTSKTKIKVDVQGKKVEKEVHKVQILDPATGTGTFLAEVVKHIHKKFQGQQGIWSNYVETHLLPRLNGFELLMASYAMAHLKLDLLLTETGFKPTSNQRFKVYLTNSLEEHHQDTGTLFANWLSNEANEANHIKRDTPVMCVIGNPPYSISSYNQSNYIDDLMELYRTDVKDEKNIQLLSDDYAKFIRYCHNRIEQSGYGTVGLITKNTYLNVTAFKGMRIKLLEYFDKIYILNLHGKMYEKCSDGTPNENVFDIRVGTAIMFLVKNNTKQKNKLGKLFVKELNGLRDFKYNYLAENNLKSIDWEELEVDSTYFFFENKNFINSDLYNTGFSVDDIFKTNNSGVETGRDHFILADTKIELENRLNNFINEEISINEIRTKYNLKDQPKFKLELVHNSFKTVVKNKLDKYSHKPFYNRFVYYDKLLLRRHSEKVMSHFLNIKENTSLVLKKRFKDDNYHHCFCTNSITDRNFLSGQTYVFPLYIYPKEKDGIFSKNERTPNLNTEIVNQIAENLGLTFTNEKETTENTFAPIDILDYIYAVLHSPTYREKYKEFLKIDFPRVPYPKDKDTFWQLVKLGGEIRQIHLLESPKVEQYITQYPMDGDNVVGKPKYKDGKVYINDTQYFDNVPQVAWEFYIGGYQPAQKWLKDRKGRTLEFDDILHYQKIIVALSETDRLMKEIDKIEIE